MAEERASLDEILEAAAEGGVSIVMGGGVVESLDDVPEEIRNLPTDFESHVVPVEGRTTADVTHRETDEEPTKQRPEDQILPTASRHLPVAHEEVIEDLQERLQIGIRRYGQGLRPFNGRNTLQDEYEELLDQIVYKKTLLLMRSATREVLIEQAAEEVAQTFEKMLPHVVTRMNFATEIATRVIDRILDCFTGLETKAPDAG